MHLDMATGHGRRKTKKLTEQLERCPFCGAGVEVYVRSCPACSHELVEEKSAVFRKLRDAGTVSAAAFDEIVRLLESGPEAIDARASSSRIRKQVGDLAPSDLKEYPTWEFAIDEEGEEGDEETVRPRPEVKFVDPAEGLFIVRAEFAGRPRGRRARRRDQRVHALRIRSHGEDHAADVGRRRTPTLTLVTTPWHGPVSGMSPDGSVV